MSADSECPICKNTRPDDGMKILCCGHKLCWECFATLMRTENRISVSCPLCRKVDGPEENILDDEDEDEDDDDDDEDECDFTQSAETGRSIRHSTLKFVRCNVWFV